MNVDNSGKPYQIDKTYEDERVDSRRVRNALRNLYSRVIEETLCRNVEHCRVDLDSVTFSLLDDGRRELAKHGIFDEEAGFIVLDHVNCIFAREGLSERNLELYMISSGYTVDMLRRRMNERYDSVNKTRSLVSELFYERHLPVIRKALGQKN